MSDSENIEPIPFAVIERFRRQCRRRFASAIVLAMADTDCSFEVIAARIKSSPDKLQAILDGLIAGKKYPTEMAFISDMFLGMGCEPACTFEEISPQKLLINEPPK